MAPFPSLAQLCQANTEVLKAGAAGLLEPVLRSYALPDFWGQVVTLKVLDDETVIRDLIDSCPTGRKRILVIDGGGSSHSIVGDYVVKRAWEKGWAGILVNGFVREVSLIKTYYIGVLALGSNPIMAEMKTSGDGDMNVPVKVAGRQIMEGNWLYADQDGVLISETELSFPS